MLGDFSPTMDDFGADFQRLVESGTTMYLELTPLQAWAIMAQLQLALRHPANGGITRQVAQDVVTILATELGTTPALRAMIEMGNNPDGVTV